MFVLLAALVGVTLAAGPVSAEPDLTTTFVPASAAVHVNGSMPDDNFASASRLVSRDDVGGDSRILLRFALDHTTIDPRTFEIVSASIHLRATTVTVSGDHDAERKTSDAWNPTSVTFSSMGTTEPMSPVSRVRVDAAGDVEWPLDVAWVADAIRASWTGWPQNDGNLSIAIVPVDGDAAFSRSLAPYLEIVHRVDASRPQTGLTITSPDAAAIVDAAARGWWRTPVALDATCQDARTACVDTWFLVNGQTISGSATSATATISDDLGPPGHRVQACTRDAVLQVNCTAPAFFKMDRTPPVTTSLVVGDAGSAPAWFRSDVAVTLACKDQAGLSGCDVTTYAVDGAPSQPYVTSAPIAISTEGSHTLEFSSQDKAGNDEALISRVVGIDRTPPSIAGSLVGVQGLDGWWMTAPTLAVTCADALSGCNATEHAIGDAAWEPHDPLAGPTVPEGVHNVSFRASDRAGNVAPTELLVVKVDTVAPTTEASVSTVNGSGWVVAPATLTLQCGDDTSGCASQAYSFDGGETWRTYDPFAPPTLPEGRFEVLHRASDAAGNVATGSLSVNVDTRGPTSTAVVAGVAGASGWWTSAVDVAVGAVDDTLLAPADQVSGVARVNQRARLANASATGDFQEALAPLRFGEGRHAVDHFGVDHAGNNGSRSTLYVDVDVTPPSTAPVFVGVEGAGGWWLSAVSIRLRCVDATSGCATSFASLDGAPPVPLASDESVLAEEDGELAFAFHSVDVAGNAEAPNAITVRVDRVAPTSTLLWQGPHAHEDPATGVRYISSAQPLAIEAADAHSGVERIEWRIVRGETVEGWKPYLGPFMIPATWADGPLALQHRAIDVAGNVQETVAVAWVLDNGAPTLVFERPFAPSAELNGTSVSLFLVRNQLPGQLRPTVASLPFANRAIVSGVVNVSAVAQDAFAGVEGVSLRIDGVLHPPAGAANPHAWVWDTRGGGMRNATLTLRGVDHVGNERELSMSVLVLPEGDEAPEDAVGRVGVVAPLAAESEIPTVPIFHLDCVGLVLRDGVAVRGDRAEPGSVPVQAPLLLYLCPAGSGSAPRAEVHDLSESNTLDDAGGFVGSEAEKTYDAVREEADGRTGEDLPDDLEAPG